MRFLLLILLTFSTLVYAGQRKTDYDLALEACQQYKIKKRATILAWNHYKHIIQSIKYEDTGILWIYKDIKKAHCIGYFSVGITEHASVILQTYYLVDYK